MVSSTRTPTWRSPRSGDNCTNSLKGEHFTLLHLGILFPYCLFVDFKLLSLATTASCIFISMLAMQGNTFYLDDTTNFRYLQCKMQQIFFQCGVLSDRCVRGEEGHDRDQARDRLGAARQGRDR